MNNPLVLILLIVGMVICSRGRKLNNYMFTSGYRFFLILFIAGLYLAAVNTLLPLFIFAQQNPALIQRINFVMTMSRIPGVVLGVIAFLVLIIAFYRNLESEADKKPG